MGHKIGYKITLTIITLTLFLITASTIVPSTHAVEWSADIKLTIDDNYIDSAPSIAQAADGNMWVVWDSYRTDNNEIFYSVYDGIFWSDAFQLTNDSRDDSHPAIMRASNGDMWVVWESLRDEPDFDLYYKVYNDSWSDADQLTTDFHNDRHPAIMEASNGDIWVVWESDRNENNWDLYYKVYNGSWSNDTLVPTDPNMNDRYPSIMQHTGGKVWVAFTKVVGTKEYIYYKLFNGTSWFGDNQLIFHPASSDSHPSIMQASDEAIWVVWSSFRNEHDDNIYYKVRNTIWTGDLKLTTDQSDDYLPSITQAADGTIWVVWTSTRQANFDIYYKTTIESPFHDITVIEVTANPTTVVQGENISIEATTQNQGTYPETFEVQFHANSTLIGSTTISLSPGQTNIMYPPFKWNTTGVPRGTYIISATAVAVPGETDLADNSRDADEPVEVRILGDICGMYEGDLLPIPDGVVDLYDLTAVAMLGPYSSENPNWDPVWGPVCDVNKDGKVGEADLIVISVHFGET